MPITHRTSLTQEIINQIEVLCREGWSESEIRYFAGISHCQWHEYRRENPELDKKIKEWKKYSLESVERSLHQKAIGYRTIDEKQTILVANGKQKLVKIERTIKQHPPDSFAAQFILKNKKPLEYRDNMTLSVEKVSSLSNADVESMFDEIQKKHGEKKILELKKEDYEVASQESKDE